MASFKNTLIRSIKAGQKTREEYEILISSWILRGWLTEDEAADVLVVLNQYYPVEEPTE